MDSEDYKVVYRLQSSERNSWKSMDWTPPWVDTALQRMGSAAAAVVAAMGASVFDSAISVVAVVVVVVQ